MKPSVFDGLIQRTDPIVWSQLNDQQPWYCYQEDGFIIQEKFHKNFKLGQIKKILTHLTSNPSYRHVSEPQGNGVRSFFDIHHACPELLNLVLTKELLATVDTILGGDSVIYQSHVNFKSAYQGQSFDWHSDYNYWHHHDGMLTPRAVSIVIPLGKHHRENGGLQILTGSHKYFYPTKLERQGQWQQEQVRHGQDSDRLANGLVPLAFVEHPEFQKNIYCADMEAGDCLIMDANSWHYSPPNTSSQDRATLFIIVTHLENKFDVKAIDYRPPHIKCMKRIPLRSFLPVSGSN